MRLFIRNDLNLYLYFFFQKLIRSELVADLTLRPSVGVIRFLEKTVGNLDLKRRKF